VYDAIKTIALSAAPLFMEGYNHAKSITYKSAVDLVTEYDVKVELFLKEKLSATFPDHTLVGEETNEGNMHPEKAIYIDPIDGTTNYVHGIPFCAISIGIWEGGKAVAGVVYNPVLDELEGQRGVLQRREAAGERGTEPREVAHRDGFSLYEDGTGGGLSLGDEEHGSDASLYPGHAPSRLGGHGPLLCSAGDL